MSKAAQLAALIGSGQAQGDKNLIINGAMQVDQRNGGASINIAGAAYYIVDRMASFKGAASGIITGQQSTLGNLKSYKMTTSTAVTSFSGTERVHALIHVIESQNVFFANGKTVTLSFKVETNWSGNLSVRLGNHNWTRTYIVNAEVVAGVNDVAISVPLESNTIVANDNSAGLVIEIGTNAQGSLQTSTEGSWIAGDDRNLTSSTQWMLTAGTYINLTALQLEVGKVATPFEHRSYGEELALCKRYFQKLGIGVPGYSNSLGEAISFAFRFTPEMRAQPTVSINNTTFAFADTFVSLRNASSPSISYNGFTQVAGSETSGGELQITTGTNTTANSFQQLYSEDAIYFNSEL